MPQDKIWPFNGYAPGNYMNTCAVCKQDTTGVDKLCFVCLPCAITGAKEMIAKLTQTPDPSHPLSRYLLEGHFISSSMGEEYDFIESDPKNVCKLLEEKGWRVKDGRVYGPNETKNWKE